MFALSLYHTSPKCYKFLRKIFLLPGISKLKSHVKNVNIEPGCHQTGQISEEGPDETQHLVLQIGLGTNIPTP